MPGSVGVGDAGGGCRLACSLVASSAAFRIGPQEMHCARRRVLRVERRERASVAVALLENRRPAQPRLRPFEREHLKQVHVVT